MKEERLCDNKVEGSRAVTVGFPIERMENVVLVHSVVGGLR